MGLTKKGWLFETQVFHGLSQLVRELKGAGFMMARGHAKDSGSAGKMNTGQIMLVFEREVHSIQYTEENLEHNALIAFTDEERQDVEEILAHFEGKVKIAGNDPIARVPAEHLYMKCGPMRLPQAGSPSLSMSVVGPHLGEVEMVRVSLNPPLELWHIIPHWLEKRARFDRTSSIASIEGSIDRM
jgi:hypothetical protein